LKNASLTGSTELFLPDDETGSENAQMRTWRDKAKHLLIYMQIQKMKNTSEYRKYSIKKPSSTR